ncbi:hypothetical protein ACOCEA_09305 [Maribacter sp. CXY002]
MKHNRRMLPTTASKFAFFTNMPRNKSVRWVAAKESHSLAMQN